MDSAVRYTKQQQAKQINSRKSHLFDWLSNDITEKVNDYFASAAGVNNVVAIGSKKYAADSQYRFWLAVMLIVSQKYRDKLLYRAAYVKDAPVLVGGTFICPVAYFYVTQVLYKPIELANHLDDKPTSMHKLLECYAQQACDDNWQDCQISRSNTLSEQYTDSFFKPVAAILKDRRRKLGDSYNAISKSRISAYGAYFLMAKSNTVHVPEQLSLLDVFAALPAPLTWQQPVPYGIEKTQSPANGAEKLKSILETLNERYGLLRSLGMNPEDWLNDEALSIDRLKKLKALIKSLKADENTYLAQGKAWDEYAAFLRIFDAAKGDKKNYAHFTTGQECYQFYFSAIKHSTIKQVNDNETVSSVFDGDDQDEVQDASREDLAELMQFPHYYPTLFNPVTSYLWERFMSDDAIGLCGKQAKVLLNDMIFRHLVDHHADLGYADLSDSRLLSRLSQEFKVIFGQFNEGGNYGN